MALEKPYSVRFPLEIRPKELEPEPAYQTPPALSRARLVGLLLPVGMTYSLKLPLEGKNTPILLPSYSVNQTLPEASMAMPMGWLLPVGMPHSVNWPLPVGTRRAILLEFRSVNQTLPELSTAMPQGWLLEVGTSYSSKSLFEGEKRPILLPLPSVNHTLPELSRAMPRGSLSLVGTLSCPRTPVGVMLPILLPATSVNQTRLLASTAMPKGWLSEVEMLKSWMTPLGFTLPILLPASSVNHTLPKESSARLVGWLLPVGTAHSAGAVWALTVAARADITRMATNTRRFRPRVLVSFAVKFPYSFPIERMGAPTSAPFHIGARDEMGSLPGAGRIHPTGALGGIRKPDGRPGAIICGIGPHFKAFWVSRSRGKGQWGQPGPEPGRGSAKPGVIPCPLRCFAPDDVRLSGAQIP